MKKKTKKKIIKGSLCVLTGFFFLTIAYYERTIDRSPMIIAQIEENNNNRVYKEVEKEDLLDTLKNETGVFLFVSNRIDANKFIDMLYEYKENYTIYVYSLKNDEMEISLNEEKSVVVNKKQSSLYEELIDYLGAYADDQMLLQEDGTVVKTNYKVIYTPTAFFVKEGKPIYSFSFMNEKISNEDLKVIYKQGFETLRNG